MTPTHKELVEALREAKNALHHAEQSLKWLKPTNKKWFYLGVEQDPNGVHKSHGLCSEALSKINPILKELGTE